MCRIRQGYASKLAFFAANVIQLSPPAWYNMNMLVNIRNKYTMHVMPETKTIFGTEFKEFAKLYNEFTRQIQYRENHNMSNRETDQIRNARHQIVNVLLNPHHQ